MTIRVTYDQARTELAALWEDVIQRREIVIIERRGAQDVALIAADELSGLIETVHLLRSPANAIRLYSALDRMRHGEGIPQTIDDLAWE